MALDLQITTDNAVQGLDDIIERLGKFESALEGIDTRPIDTLGEKFASIEGPPDSAIANIEKLNEAIGKLTQAGDMTALVDSFKQLGEIDTAKLADDVEKLSEALSKLVVPQGLADIAKHFESISSSSAKAQEGLEAVAKKAEEAGAKTEGMSGKIADAVGHFSGVEGGANAASKAFEAFAASGNIVFGVIAGLTALFASISFARISSEAIDAADSIEKLGRKISVFSKDADAAPQAIEKLRTIADATGFSVEALEKTFGKYAQTALATGKSLTTVTDNFAKVAKGAQAVGQDEASIGRFLTVIDRAMAGGSIGAQTLARALQQMGLSLKVLAPDLVNLAANTRVSAGQMQGIIDKIGALEPKALTLTAQITRLDNAWNAMVVSFGQGQFGSETESMGHLADTVRSFQPELNGLMYAAGAAYGVLKDFFILVGQFGVAALGETIRIVKGLYDVLNTLTFGALGYLGQGLAAAVSYGYQFAQTFGGAIVDALNTQLNVLRNVANFVAGELVNAFNWALDAGKSFWNMLSTFAVISLVATWNALPDWLTGPLSAAWDYAKDAASRWYDNTKSAVADLWAYAKPTIDSLIDKIKELWAVLSSAPPQSGAAGGTGNAALDALNKGLNASASSDPTKPNPGGAPKTTGPASGTGALGTGGSLPILDGGRYTTSDADYKKLDAATPHPASTGNTSGYLGSSWFLNLVAMQNGADSKGFFPDGQRALPLNGTGNLPSSDSTGTTTSPNGQNSGAFVETQPSNVNSSVIQGQQFTPDMMPQTPLNMPTQAPSELQALERPLSLLGVSIDELNASSQRAIDQNREFSGVNTENMKILGDEIKNIPGDLADSMLEPLTMLADSNADLASSFQDGSQRIDAALQDTVASLDAVTSVTGENTDYTWRDSVAEIDNTQSIDALTDAVQVDTAATMADAAATAASNSIGTDSNGAANGNAADGGGGGGGGDGGGDVQSAKFGGLTSSPRNFQNVSASMFDGARHFAEGGLTDGGIPAIVHPGEAVIPLQGGGVPVNLNDGGGVGVMRDINQSVKDVGQYVINVGTLLHNDFDRNHQDLLRLQSTITILGSSLSTRSSGGGGSSGSVGGTTGAAGTGGRMVNVVTAIGTIPMTEADAANYKHSFANAADSYAPDYAGYVGQINAGNFGGTDTDSLKGTNLFGDLKQIQAQNKSIEQLGSAPTTTTVPPKFATGSPNAERDITGGFQATLHPNEAVIPLPDGRSVPIDDRGMFARMDEWLLNQGSPSAGGASTSGGGARRPAANAGGAQGTGIRQSPIIVNLTVHAKDAASFNASKNQLLQDLQRDLQQAVKTIGSAPVFDDPTIRVRD